MPAPLTPESLHDLDWRGAKADPAFFERSPRYPFIADLIVPLKPSHLFDLGCGSGYLVHLIKEQLPDVRVDGVDVSRVALEQARRHLDRVWHLDIDRSNLPVPDNSYDVVTCVEVLEHVYDPLHALSEICRILQMRGSAVITVPNLAYWRYRLDLLRGRIPGPAADRRHLHQFNRQFLDQTARQAGLIPVGIFGFGVRAARLAGWKPELFSDILIAVLERDARHTC